MTDQNQPTKTDDANRHCSVSSGSVRERAIGTILQIDQRRKVAEATDDLVQAKLHKAQIAKETSANKLRIDRLEKFLAQNRENTH